MPHALQFPIHAAAVNQASLSAAIEHLLNGVERRVIDAIAKCQIENSSGRDKLYRQNAEAFQQSIGQNARTDEIARCLPDKNRTSPLKSERRSYLLLGGKAKFLKQFPQATMPAGALGFESDLQLRIGNLATRNHEQ